MKVVINRRFGGFGLSHEAIMRYLELAGKRVWIENGQYAWQTTYWLVPPEGREQSPEGAEWAALPIERRQEINRRLSEQQFYYRTLERTDPLLVRVVEEMGEAADGDHANLVVVEIPDGMSYEIDDYDGMESIHETHRSWA